MTLYQLEMQLRSGQWVKVGLPKEDEESVWWSTSRMRAAGELRFRVVGVSLLEHVSDCLCPECIRGRRDRQLALDVRPGVVAAGNNSRPPGRGL